MSRYHHCFRVLRQRHWRKMLFHMRRSQDWQWSKWVLPLIVTTFIILSQFIQYRVGTGNYFETTCLFQPRLSARWYVFIPASMWPVLHLLLYQFMNVLFTIICIIQILVVISFRNNFIYWANFMWNKLFTCISLKKTNG